MVHNVCSFYYKSYISLWVHGPVRPKNAHNHLSVWTHREWCIMRSEHCRGSVFKHEFPSSTWFKRDRSSLRHIKWWNWNAFQSRLFYDGDRKYWGDGRQVNEASNLQEAYCAINFSCFLGDKIGLITSDKNIIFVPLPRFLSEITHLFPSKIRRWRTTQVRGEGKPDQSAILSFLEGKSWSLLS